MRSIPASPTFLIAFFVIGLSLTFDCFAQESMDKLWGDRVVKLRADNAERGQLFDEGNYAMFIHWGLYSQLGNKVDDKTYYGIGEWIMNKNMANIPVDEYKKLAGTFNPVNFDAKKIASIAKDAGMKYIIITAKHHDGFAMYDSDACDFNIVDATPWGKDPMKELATACREAGLGFGFITHTPRIGHSPAVAAVPDATKMATGQRSRITLRRNACRKSMKSRLSTAPLNWCGSIRLERFPRNMWRNWSHWFTRTNPMRWYPVEPVMALATIKPLVTWKCREATSMGCGKASTRRTIRGPMLGTTKTGSHPKRFLID